MYGVWFLLIVIQSARLVASMVATSVFLLSKGYKPDRVFASPNVQCARTINSRVEPGLAS